MLVSMVMLGLQLCYPLTLQASVVSAQQVDMIGLGVKDPSGKPGIHVDFELPPMAVSFLFTPARSVIPGLPAQCSRDVSIPAVLPVAGYHPSAP
ncbi:MAG: hypothetical protein R2817_10770 [Flavobacteriales bacterium]|jgi:hypothetical protein